jgi:predicted RNA-binding Zn ribbon-like protein
MAKTLTIGPLAQTNRPFELTGGSACLDFVNTVDDRPTLRRQELLQNIPDLLRWGRQSGILEQKESLRLSNAAQRHPQEAAAALSRAKSFREALFRIFTAIAEGQRPPKADVAVLNHTLRKIAQNVRLAAGRNGFTWEWAGAEDSFDRILWPIARSAADLLMSDERAQVRICAAGECDWLFVDRSRNRKRRWCDMKTCGNRHKARRFYARRRATSA